MLDLSFSDIVFLIDFVLDVLDNRHVRRADFDNLFHVLLTEHSSGLGVDGQNKPCERFECDV